MCNSIVSVIVTDNAPVNCSTISLLFLITVLEVFAKVNVTLLLSEVANLQSFILAGDK